jgi:undecaprenyl-diphosphatase
VLLSPAARALNNWALKVTIERPRPSAEHVRFESQPDSFSFPSGHAESAFLLYGLIFYFASIHIHDWRWRLPVQIACVVIIILSGIERVYVGHHWPSDVIGGYYIGALILAGLITVHQLATGLHSNLWPQRSLSRTRVAPGPDELA